MIILIGNGPSNKQFQGMLDDCTIIGCNKGFCDWPVTHLFVRDKTAFLHLDEKYRDELPDSCWVPAKYLAETKTYGFSDKWKPMERPTPPNAGACAILLASRLYPGEDLYCIGYDSIMAPQGNANITLYEYPFRSSNIIKESTSISHRKQVRQAVADVQDLNTVTFVSDTPFKRLWKYEDWDLQTIPSEDFIKLVKGEPSCNQNADTKEETLNIGGVESENIHNPEEEKSS